MKMWLQYETLPNYPINIKHNAKGFDNNLIYEFLNQFKINSKKPKFCITLYEAELFKEIVINLVSESSEKEAIQISLKYEQDQDKKQIIEAYIDTFLPEQGKWNKKKFDDQESIDKAARFFLYLLEAYQG